MMSRERQRESQRESQREGQDRENDGPTAGFAFAASPRLSCSDFYMTSYRHRFGSENSLYIIESERGRG